MQVLFPYLLALKLASRGASQLSLQLAGKLQQLHWRCAAVSSDLHSSVDHREQ